METAQVERETAQMERQHGKLETAMIFGNHMVLQRNKKIPIWGSGKEGETVTVVFQKQEVSAVIKNGTWSICLQPVSATTGETLEIVSGQEKLVYRDVAVGEVWIAGGQSNMEFFLKYDEEFELAMEQAETNEIRFFDYPEVAYEGGLKDADYSDFGFWRECNRENIPYYSAVGYYFAKKVRDELNIPVGIIGCNWGGSPACTWMEESYLENNDGELWLQEYAAAMKDMDIEKTKREFYENPANFVKGAFDDPNLAKLMVGISCKEQEEIIAQQGVTEPLVGPFDFHRPGALYHTMLQKLVPFAICGVIWYQGESDDKHAEQYGTVFSQLIRCWRDSWNEELPFLFVQLAPYRKWLIYDGVNFPEVRRQQEWVSKHVPETWMATIMDSGMEWDIHPKRKRPVGERLAALAIGKVYGYDVPCEAPECAFMQVENGTILLTFQHADGDLQVKGSEVNALRVNLNGKELIGYTAKPEGNQLLIQDSRIHEEDQITISFADCDYCEVNLYNGYGFSAKPFQISNY